MTEITRNAKVAVFALALGTALVVLWTYFGKGDRFGKKGIKLYLTMNDATGLAPLSRVHMAGIGIGNIKEINLTPQGKARIQLQMQAAVGEAGGNGAHWPPSSSRTLWARSTSSSVTAREA